MTTTEQLNQQLDGMLGAGDMLEAFEMFYAPDVVMQENDDPPTRGKDANRDRELAFVASIVEVHANALLDSATAGDVSYSEWSTDLTLRDYGRVRRTQVAKRQWKDGKVVNERFYYKA